MQEIHFSSLKSDNTLGYEGLMILYMGIRRYTFSINSVAEVGINPISIYVIDVLAEVGLTPTSAPLFM